MSVGKEGLQFFPEKTAVKKGHRGYVAGWVDEVLVRCKLIDKVLDYGCSYGEDIPFYRQLGLDATGYDPYPPFGWAEMPQGQFDLVTLNFVLNVLSDEEARLEVLKSASGYLAENGLLVVVARSKTAVEKEATKNHWPRYSDGYWSSRTKGMFQHGMTREEIIGLSLQLGLVVSPFDVLSRQGSRHRMVVLEKRAVEC